MSISAAAITLCARLAYGAERELGPWPNEAEPCGPAWVDLLPEERERHVLRAELLLSGGAANDAERFIAAVVLAASVEVGLRAVAAPRRGGVRAGGRPGVEDIARATAAARGTTIKVLLGNARTRDTATVRHLAMLLAHDDFGFSLPVIGRFFGGRHHTTVKSNVESMRVVLRFTEELRTAHVQIRGTLRGAGGHHDERR